MHWRPERRPPLFCSRVVFFSFSLEHYYLKWSFTKTYYLKWSCTEMFSPSIIKFALVVFVHLWTCTCAPFILCLWYADIKSVWPSVGSPEGGTLVTITGEYFIDDLEDVEVFVGGKLKIMTTLMYTSNKHKRDRNKFLTSTYIPSSLCCVWQNELLVGMCIALECGVC